MITLLWLRSSVVFNLPSWWPRGTRRLWVRLGGRARQCESRMRQAACRKAARGGERAGKSVSRAQPFSPPEPGVQREADQAAKDDWIISFSLLRTGTCWKCSPSVEWRPRYESKERKNRFDKWLRKREMLWNAAEVCFRDKKGKFGRRLEG